MVKNRNRPQINTFFYAKLPLKVNQSKCKGSIATATKLYFVDSNLNQGTTHILDSFVTDNSYRQNFLSTFAKIFGLPNLPAQSSDYRGSHSAWLLCKQRYSFL